LSLVERVARFFGGLDHGVLGFHELRTKATWSGWWATRARTSGLIPGRSWGCLSPGVPGLIVSHRRKADWVTAVWELVNWEDVAQRYAKVTQADVGLNQGLFIGARE